MSVRIFRRTWLTPLNWTNRFRVMVTSYLLHCHSKSRNCGCDICWYTFKGTRIPIFLKTLHSDTGTLTHRQNVLRSRTTQLLQITTNWRIGTYYKSGTVGHSQRNTLLLQLRNAAATTTATSRAWMAADWIRAWKPSSFAFNALNIMYTSYVEVVQCTVHRLYSI